MKINTSKIMFLVLAGLTICCVSTTIANAFTGDELLVVGSLPVGMISSITSGSGTITVTLTGTFTKAQYADAIEKINYRSTSEAPRMPT